jgi:hypothetical protein
MTKSSLNTGQRQTVEIIEALGFGVIEHLSICGGLPTYTAEPRITQTIKLDPQPGRQADRRDAGLSLNKAFENLFDQLNRLREGIVDIEVQHGLPFRLVLERRYQELL